MLTPNPVRDAPARADVSGRGQGMRTLGCVTLVSRGAVSSCHSEAHPAALGSTWLWDFVLTMRGLPNWVRFVDALHFFARERREEVRLPGF